MKELQELKNTVAYLRGPKGCQWDREQTHESLTPHLIEECSELLETIDRNDTVHMREELGDLLLNIFLHAQIEEEAGHFGIEDVARDVNEKLIRRHPHVYGDAVVKDMDGLYEQWERIKASEKPGVKESLIKKMPSRLSALKFARDVYEQIHQLDLMSEYDSNFLEELGVELDEKMIGVILFQTAAVCYKMGIDPELALRRVAQGIVDIINSEQEDGNGRVKVSKKRKQKVK